MHTKLIRPLISFSLICVLFTTVLPALAQGGGSFSLRPDPSATSSLNGGYFEYTLQPGAVVNDAVLIVNAGGEAVGVAFPGGAQDTTQRAGAWLKLSASEMTLQPGEARTVPFTFAIPEGITGEFAAVIVAQPAMTAAAERGQLAITIVQRAAVTVVATVQGDTPLAPQMEIAALAAEVNGEQQLVNATLRNSGQLGLRPQGMLIMTDDADTIVRAVPVELGYFLSGDEIGYRMGIEPPLSSGDYNVTLELTYDGGQAAQSTRLTLTEPNFEGEIIEFDAPETVPEQGSAAYADGLPATWAFLAVGAMLLFASLALLKTARLALTGGRTRKRSR